MKPWQLIKSTVSIIISASILCTTSILPDKISAQEIVVEYQSYDVSEMEIAISDFNDQLEQHNNEDGVTEAFNALIIEKNKIQTQEELAYINYVADTSQDNIDEYNNMCQTEVECVDKLYDALNNALNTRYKSLVKQLLGEYYFAVDEYDMSSKDYTEISTVKQNIQQEYQQIINSSDSTDVKNIKCADLYLKLVKKLNDVMRPYGCNYFEYAYYVYNRDYSVDEITELSPYVKTDIKDYFNKVRNSIDNLKKYPQKSLESYTFENNFEEIKNYAGEISDELYDSAMLITENDLYRFGSGSNSVDMAFTTVLPQYNTAFIYQYLYNNEKDILSSIHEFGHFNTMRQCDISSSMEGSTINLDISEVQSQGLEVLYTTFYSRIFDGNKEYFRQQLYAEMLQSISSGFMVNEFESYVFNNAENMTAADVVEKYKSINDEYEIFPIEFYKIHHMFRTPGYYISYATSALAAVELWDMLDNSFDDAVDVYTTFSHFDPTDENNKYKECLEKSGFGNVLSSEYITHLADITDNILSNVIYGDIDENGIVSANDALLMKKYILDTRSTSVNDTNKRYDLNRDNTVNVADLCSLIDLLLCA